MDSKPTIKKPSGDQPILDILQIAYFDLLLGRLTSVEKLHRVMYSAYPSYDRKYINNIIKIITGSPWFKRYTYPVTNKKVIYLQEKGVEAYLTMVQLRDTERYARQADFKANILIFLTIATIIVMLLIEIFKK